MPYDVLLHPRVDEFLNDDKTEWICRDNLGYLADNPPGSGRSDRERLPVEG